MLLLDTLFKAAVLFLISIAAIPLDTGALSSAAVPNAYLSPSQSAPPIFEVFKRAPGAKRAIRKAIALQSRTLVSSGASINLNEVLSLPTYTGEIDHDVDCFPTGSRLPYANADDCKFIIDFIILGMKDPFREQTWGFTNNVDIDLSLPQYRWIFNDCFIKVTNIDHDQVDRFRPVDVAEAAQRLIQQCVTETKESFGGNVDIGQLAFPRTFYVVLSGTAKARNESLRNNTKLSLPSDEPHTLEQRASLILPEEATLPIVLPKALKPGEPYPVHCFDPTSTRHLKPAIASDCEFIINEFILTRPNPMIEQTFGFTDAADVNLSNLENRRWVFGQCVVFITSIDKTRIDRFRYVDVAQTAYRILDPCVERSKYPIGGTANVGTTGDSYYVAVGGIDLTDVGNGTILRLSSDIVVSSSPSATPASSVKKPMVPTSSYDHSVTELANLAKRSSNITQLLRAINDFTPAVRCLGSGTPVSRKINIEDCTDAAMVLLSDPKVLVPQLFTTEPTGGIEMPFVQNNQSCYLMMDTNMELSISDTIPMLKMVYWALEIMLACVSGREQGFGGVSALDEDKGIYVSVTGIDPTNMGNGLASLSDESTSWQMVDLGQS